MDDIRFDVKFNSNKNLVLDELEKAMEKALYVTGTEAQAGIVDYMSEPDFTGRDMVDTGRLRASISFVTPKKNGKRLKQAVTSKDTDYIAGLAPENCTLVGSNVEYASYVNNGTSRQSAREFIQHGIENRIRNIEDLVNKIFKGEL